MHDQEYEAVLFPLSKQVDVSLARGVDYDDRDLREERAADDRLPPERRAARLLDVLEAGPARPHRSPHPQPLDGAPRQPGAEALRAGRRVGRGLRRPLLSQVAGERADAELAKLRSKYEAKATTLRNRLEAASDAVQVARDQQEARSRDDMLSSAGSILGGLLGGRRSRGGLVGQIGRAAGRAGRTSAAGSRVEAAENKAARLQDDLEDLEAAAGRRADRHRPALAGEGQARRVDDRGAGTHRRQDHPPRRLAWIPVA